MCVCVREREREREIKKERKRERKTDRQTEERERENNFKEIHNMKNRIKSTKVDTKWLKVLDVGCWRISQSTWPDYADLENIFGESSHLLQALALPTMSSTPRHISFTSVHYTYVLDIVRSS